MQTVLRAGHHARAAQALERERRAVVRDLVQRFAVPIDVVLAGNEIEPELQAAVDRVPVAHVLGWVPEVAATSAARLMTAAGLDPRSNIRLGDLPAGVRGQLVAAVNDRRRAARRRGREA